MPIAEPRLPHRIWALLVMLVVFSIGWTVRLLRTFRLPEEKRAR